MCREKIHLSLNMRQYSDFPEPPQTVPSITDELAQAEAKSRRTGKPARDRDSAGKRGDRR